MIRYDLSDLRDSNCVTQLMFSPLLFLSFPPLRHSSHPTYTSTLRNSTLLSLFAKLCKLLQAKQPRRKGKKEKFILNLHYQQLVVLCSVSPCSSAWFNSTQSIDTMKYDAMQYNQQTFLTCVRHHYCNHFTHPHSLHVIHNSVKFDLTAAVTNISRQPRQSKLSHAMFCD